MWLSSAETLVCQPHSPGLFSSLLSLPRSVQNFDKEPPCPGRSQVSPSGHVDSQGQCQGSLGYSPAAGHLSFCDLASALNYAPPS